MRWDAVLRMIVRAVDADPVLSAIYPTRRLAATDQEHAVPSLEWRVVADAGSELYEPCVIQFDQWVADFSDLYEGERALRRLFDQDLPVTIQGVYCWSEFESGDILEVPDRANFYGRALRFRISPIREDLRCGRTI